MKKILILPVKNEEWILEKTLSAATLWADHIIAADHGSTDTTRAILSRYDKVTVITNTHPYHTSTIRLELLHAARSFEGCNAIFSFDADEVPTAHILSKVFWEKVESLKPGTSIYMEWVNLWRSPLQYRIDGDIQSPQWKAFGFIDDRTMEYTSVGVINDHTARVPAQALLMPERLDYPKVLHYQFVDWDRLLSKQAHYRMVEWLQKERTTLSALKINTKYFASKDERGLARVPVPEEWLAAYDRAGIDLRIIQCPHPTWHDMQILKYFQKYGPAYFADLDIWDIPWQEIGGHIKAQGYDMRSATHDPRTRTQVYMQRLLPLWYSVYKVAAKVRAYI